MASHKDVVEEVGEKDDGAGVVDVIVFMIVIIIISIIIITKTNP